MNESDRELLMQAAGALAVATQDENMAARFIERFVLAAAPVTGDRETAGVDLQMPLQERLTRNVKDDVKTSTSPVIWTDQMRMNWLEHQHVEVRTPLVHGSRANFHASPDDSEGDTTPSDLRARIDATLSSGASNVRATPPSGGGDHAGGEAQAGMSEREELARLIGVPQLSPAEFQHWAMNGKTYPNDYQSLVDDAFARADRVLTSEVWSARATAAPASGVLDEDARRRLSETSVSLRAGHSGLPVGFHQLAADIDAVLAASLKAQGSDVGLDQERDECIKLVGRLRKVVARIPGYTPEAEAQRWLTRIEHKLAASRTGQKGAGS